MAEDSEPSNGEIEPLNCQDELQAAVENDDIDVKPGRLGTGIFPEELWLQILEMLTNSVHIFSVLKAFPVLDKEFQKKKAEWYFDQVLPHLMTKHLVIETDKNFGLDKDFVISRDLLKLRLVSKRLKNAVEYSIQNHADRHPINQTSEHQSATVGLPTNHFNYNRINKCHLGATKLQSPKKINYFLKEMANFEGNPFPGKHVHFELDSHSVDLSRHFVIKCVQLLQKYGEHVVILDWEIGDNIECHLELIKAIRKGLSYVPNLQTLKFFGVLYAHNKAADNYLRQTCGNLFPRLENLQSFEWQAKMHFRCGWVDSLINFYCGGGGATRLHKLALDYKYWNVEMAGNLKNLTELHLLLAVSKDCDIGTIRNVLGLFHNGQIKKFGLSDYPRINWDRKIYIDELIGIMGEFQIENVTLEHINLKEKMSDVEALGITSLYLDDSLGLSYEFLRRLPNLRFLSVHVPWESADVYLTNYFGVKDEHYLSLAFKIHRYFWNADKGYKWKEEDRDFEIWNLCGKLEMLSVSVFDGLVHGVQFVREYGNKPFWGRGGDLSGTTDEKEDQREAGLD